MTATAETTPARSDGAGDILVHVKGVKVHFPIKKGVIIDRTVGYVYACLLYTSPSPRDRQKSRMPSSA